MDYLSSYGLPPKSPPDALAAAEALAVAAGSTSTEADPLARLREEIDILATKARTPSPSWTGTMTQDEAMEQIASLRYNVSLLSEISGQLAVALNQRTQQYDTLVAQVADGVLKPVQPTAVAETPEMYSLLEQVESLHTALAEAQAANAQLEAQLDRGAAAPVEIAAEPTAAPEAEAALEELKAQLEAALAERDALDADKTSLEMQLSGQESHITELEIQLSALMSDLEVYEQSKADFDAQAADYNQQITDLTEQLAIAQTHADEMGAGRVELEAQVQDRDTELEAALAARADLEAQMGARQAEWDDLQQRLFALQAEMQPYVAEPSVEPDAVEAAEPAGEETAAPSDEAVEAPTGGEQVSGIAAVSAAVAALLAKFKQQEAALGETSTRTSDVVAQLDELQPQLDTLTADKAALEVSLTEKESALADLQANLDAQQEQLDALLAHKANLESSVQDKDNALSELQAQLDALTTDKANLEASVQEKDGAAAELQAQLDALTTDKTSLEASMQEKDSAATAMQADLATLKTTVDTLNADIAAAREQVEALTAEKAALEATIQEKDETIASLQSDLATSKTTIDNLNAQIATLNGQIEEGQAQITQLNEQVETLSKESEEGREDRDGRLAALTAGAAASAALIKRHEEDLETANTNVASLQAQIDTLTADKTALESSLQEKDQAAADLQAQIDALTADKTTLEASLAEKTQAIAEGPAEPAEDVLAQISAERDELAARVESLQAEIDAGQIDKMTLEAALQERTTELDDARAELAAAVAASAVRAEPPVEVATAEGERAADTSALEEAATAEVTEGEAAEVAEGEAAEVAAEPEVVLSPTVTNLKAGAMRAAFMLGMKPLSTSQPQDLTNIEGIGSTYEDRLYQAGIGTYWEVANLSDDELFEVLRVGARRAMTDAEGIRMSAFNLAQSSNSIGHVWSSHRIDDFEKVPGISQTYEQRLYEAGIYTYRALAEATVEQLESLIETPGHFRPAFERWIEGAKALLEEANE